MAQLVGLLERHGCKYLLDNQASILLLIFLRNGVATLYDLRQVMLALVAVDRSSRYSRPHGSPASEPFARR